MIEPSQWPLYALILSFLLSVAVIGYSGTKMALVAEHLAIQTGLGQAITGAVFIGISTSLSGTILSFYTAAQDFPSLSISNSIGGIAAQTVFLAVADVFYRKANLEHAAASLENLAQGALLVILLIIPLVAMVGPDNTIYAIHPASIVLFCVYAFGIRLTAKIKDDPMWKAKQTRLTEKEKKKIKKDSKALRALLIKFFILAAFLSTAGYLLAESAIELSERTGLEQSVMGGIFTSISTSLPELVTTLAAVRRGAINLALGDIIGGNSFDVLFLAGSDIFYRGGSLYHQINNDHILLVGMSILMTGFLMLGMLRREKVGIGRIGFESTIIFGLYILLILMLLL